MSLVPTINQILPSLLPIDTLILLAFFLCTAFQIYFWVITASGLRRYYHKASDLGVKANQPFVSVVIASKNESENLRKNLSFILEQEYHPFEVIIVDDHSSDDTGQFIQELRTRYNHLGYFKLSENEKGKKQAISKGITESRGTWILTTDADCKPVSRNWITLMMKGSDHVDVICGYGPYEKVSGWINQLVRYETWFIGVQYLSAIARGKPYMAVGRNLAYRKKAFQKVGGFEGHRHLLSGDDDLLIQSMLKDYRFSLCLHPESYMYSSAKNTTTDVIHQKLRHLTTSYEYAQTTKIWLSMVYITQLSHYAFWIYLIFTPFVFLAGSFFIIRVITILWAVKGLNRIVSSPVNWIKAVCWDFVLCLYYMGLSFFMTKNRSEW